MNTSAQSVLSPSAELPTVISKITRADLGLVVPRLDDECKDEDGHTIPSRKAKLEEQIAKYSWCYDVGGRIVDTKQVKGKGDEPGVRFVGKFRAHVNPALGGTVGGKWFVSTRCHVPKFFEEVVYAQIVEAKKENPDATVDFLIRVGIKPPKPGKPSTVGYEWTVDTLISMDVSEDPVAKMFERVTPTAALAAPSPAETADTGATGAEAAESGRGQHNGRQGRAART